MTNFYKKYIKVWWYLFTILLITSSCRQVVIKIEKVPENTPVGATIYVAGNFNFWDPGDGNYRLSLNKDSSYTVELPMVFGDIEYKFTRGDWSTVEKDKCGFEIANRFVHSAINDTIVQSVESWADLEPINCDSITIVLSNIPPNTPKNESIKIAGNFNAWNPGNDSSYVLKADKRTGELSVTIPRDSGQSINDIFYKFVRGDSSKSEADKFGQQVEKRKLIIPKEGKVRVKVDNWEDLATKRLNTVTVVLTEVPSNTPEFNSIYLVGNFNNWKPGDKNYKFSKNEKRQYSITIPRKEYGLSFKITRGGWYTEAADKNGNKLNNRNYNYDDIDTLYIKVDSWLDLAKGQKKSQTIVINKVPLNTPANDKIYLASNYNNWNTKNEEFAFKKYTNGNYVLNILKGRNDLEFKITRGDWSTQEVNKNGEEIPNRKIRFNDADTLFVEVEMWKDLIEFNKDYVTIELVKIPDYTPQNANIYIAGEFNGWNPGDNKYILKRNSSGNLSIKIPRNWLKRGFKFTRGNWKSVESTKYGRSIENRFYNGKANKIQIEIKGWEDK